MKREKLGLLAMDALCAGVLAMGAGAALLPAFGVAVRWPELAAAVIVLLGVCALCERKPWAPPAAAAAAVLVVYSIAAALGRARELCEALTEYARRAAEETAGGSPPFTVYLLCMLLPVLIFWVLSRRGGRKKQLSLWTATLLAGGIMGYKAIYMPEGWLPPFMLLCAGVILYLPRAASGSKGQLQARALAAALALPVLALCLLIGPREDGQWRSAAVGYLVQDIQDLWEFHWGGLPDLPLTSMRSMGLEPEAGRLGGDIEPGDSPVIVGDKPVLLRGRVYEVYTGHSWEDAGENDGNFRFESPIWQGRRREAFGLGSPPPVSKPLLNELLKETTVELNTRRNFRSLFLPYRTESVEAPRAGSDLYFDMQGEAYWSGSPRGSVEYLVRASVWNYRDGDFDQNMMFLEKELEAYEDDPGYEQAAGRCLQLPEELPEWVRELAMELTADCRSPYEKAAALRDYLSENCDYTLTPGPAPEGRDFVADFLTERRGYCTYYASALTVLCRCAGVPARYVTGYGMVRDGKRYAATQRTAHAWTEIYLGHIGWVPLDALGQEIFGEERREDTPSGGAAMGPQATPLPTPGAGGGLLTEEPREDGFDPMGLLWAAPVPAVIVWLLIMRLLRAARYRPEYVRRHYGEADGAEHVYSGMLRLMGMRKQKPKGGETLLGFWEHAAGTLPEDVDWQEAGRIMDRLRFGGRTPSREEVELLCGAYSRLAACTRKSLGIRGWFV